MRIILFTALTFIFAQNNIPDPWGGYSVSNSDNFDVSIDNLSKDYFCLALHFRFMFTLYTSALHFRFLFHFYMSGSYFWFRFMI